jgi:hypothetical protein
MSLITISRRLRRWLATLGERCEYCRTSEWVTGIPLEVDHILPSSQGGETSESNLCRACSTCNTNKGDRAWAIDPTTGQRTPLFNPRQQQWAEHFAWSADGAQIMGLTACGRATVEALGMNNPRIVRARRLWVAAGWHPPVE